jgi:hypothetical protein
LIGFRGGLNPKEPTNIAEYQLTMAGRRGSFTARNATAIERLSATDNATSDTVALTPAERFRLRKSVQLVVRGTAPRG